MPADRVVAALRTLSIFGADQEAAYREHFAEAAAVFGADVPTRLGERVAAWSESRQAGVWILTGNAGTGKTAVAERFCAAPLPTDDELREVSPGKWAAKDLSGLPDGVARADAVARALQFAASDAQVLLCANEGVLRDAVDALADTDLERLLDRALRDGAAEAAGRVIVNVNRQRPTADGVWSSLLDYLTREDLWSDGCDGCPLEEVGCPMRENALALRRPEVREGLRTLVRLAAGEAVPTFREVLAILAWAIVGSSTCDQVREEAGKGRKAFTSEGSYFARALGHDLEPEKIERSPLLAGMREGQLGDMADLEVDGWLRDTINAPGTIKELAGAPQRQADPEEATDPLFGTRGSHDRVRTSIGTMTFHKLGETVSTSEDTTRVDAGLDALVRGDGTSALALWRRRLYFERPEDLGGRAATGSRLLAMRYFPDLLELAKKIADDQDTLIEMAEIVEGLNFLVCGFATPNEGLIVPDPACLFARDPGSFRPARPSFVHTQIGIEDLKLRLPDRGRVRELLDVDDIEVELATSVPSLPLRALRLRPRLYEAVRQAAAFRCPVGQGIAEMSDVRAFYGHLADLPRASGLRVADPGAKPPMPVAVWMPRVANDG